MAFLVGAEATLDSPAARFYAIGVRPETAVPPANSV
jgi:hypothetical protein